MKHILLTILISMTLGLCGATAQEPAEPTKATELTVSMADNILYVIGAPMGSELVIKNMLGEKVYQNTTKNEKDTFYLNLKSGFYIVKVGNTLKKVIIK